MTQKRRFVTIKKLPEAIDQRTERRFLLELESAMNVERPVIVLDCSQMREMDCAAIHLLLCCLEEAMKRNGDVRLAAVSPGAMENLRAMGVDTLFRIFETNEMAAESFQRRTALVTLPASAASRVVAENAA